MKSIVLIITLFSSITLFASPEGPAKGYNYKKHNRRLKIHKWIDRKIHHNVCDQYPN
jgi:hypothetical protein